MVFGFNNGSSIYLYLIIFLIGPGCQRSTRLVNYGFIEDGLNVPYVLNDPDSVFILPKELKEISGLSYRPGDNTLVAINDEKGHFYILSKETGEILEDIDFGKGNDYEGVELVDNIIYVLESDGDLHPYDLSEQKSLDKIENKLGEKNDLEGIGYDAESHSLILACKDRGLDQKKNASARILYKVPIDDMKHLSEYVKVNLNDEIKHLTKNAKTRNPFFTFIVQKRLSKFAPSGVAIHPKSGDIYILSSKAGILVILDKESHKVTSILFLARSKHVQPEGICFDQDANLYISNEARGIPAKLYIFHPKHEQVKVIDESEKPNPVELLINSDSSKLDSSQEISDSLDQSQ